MTKFGVIYKITNNINKKIYIGQTREKNPYRRINRHFKKQKSIDLLYRAIQKYSKENFEIQIIYTAFDSDHLNDIEKYFITFYNSQQPNGYNIKSGGEQGGCLPLEKRLEMSRNKKEFYKTNPSPNKGRTFTKEHCENMSKVRKGFTSENRKNAHKLSRDKISKPVIAINIKTNESFLFKSIAECALILNLQACNISRVCNNKNNRSQHKGYKIEFLQKKEEKK